MTLMISGLIIFLGIHTLTTLRGPRAALVERLGAGPYKGLFSLVAGAGLILIIWGFIVYRRNGYIPVWDPPGWTRHLTITLMWFSFIMLAAAEVKGGRIRGWLRHPMLNAVKTWALAHLIANGDLGSIILFTALLLWSGYDRFAVKWRGDTGAPRVPGFTKDDAKVLVIGTIAWIAMIFLHPWLIGVAVVYI